MTQPPDPTPDERPDDGSTQPPAESAYGVHQPYGQAYGQPPAYGQPAYGAYGYPGPPQNHPSAQTAMVLGLVGLIGFFLCVLPVVLSPFAWAMGARARREIDASNGALGGRDAATVGFVTGIIGSVLLGLALLALALVVVVVVVGVSTA